MASKTVCVFMTVYHDAVKVEEELLTKRLIIGWFIDEVSALGAAVERILMRSAILPDLRQLPELVICCHYRDEWSRRPVQNFNRATKIKYSLRGRRVVMRPGAFGKVWI